MINWMKLLWIIIPAGIANMVPPFAQKLFPKWNDPMDFKQKLGNKRILGDHKTFRGMVVGIIAAEIAFLLIGRQGLPWWFGGLLGAGALLGDAIKSFFKRRANVESGKTWFPWDQIDWIIGFVLVAQIWNMLNVYEIVILLLAGLLLHLLFKAIGYFLKINKSYI